MENVTAIGFVRTALGELTVLNRTSFRTHAFPRGYADDQVDALSQGLAYVSEIRSRRHDLLLEFPEPWCGARQEHVAGLDFCGLRGHPVKAGFGTIKGFY
jgi:hypothetical protein